MPLASENFVVAFSEEHWLWRRSYLIESASTEPVVSSTLKSLSHKNGEEIFRWFLENLVGSGSSGCTTFRLENLQRRNGRCTITHQYPRVYCFVRNEDHRSLIISRTSIKITKSQLLRALKWEIQGFPKLSCAFDGSSCLSFVTPRAVYVYVSLWISF